MSSRGRPRRWVDGYDTEFGRLVLKSKLIDRIHGDKIISRELLGHGRGVALRDTFWICDGLLPRDAGKALTMQSADIAKLLKKRDVRSYPGHGRRLRDFYYSWHKPGKALLMNVGGRIDTYRSEGQSLTSAIESVAAEGLHPTRPSNKEFLPVTLLRNLYRRYQKLNL